MKPKKLTFITLSIFCMIGHSDMLGLQTSDGSATDDNSRLVFPLFSLGQNIIPKNCFFVGATVLAPYWATSHVVVTAPEILYGVTDRFCVQGYLPISVVTQCDGKQETGLGNILAGFEWAYYVHKARNSFTQATIFNQYKFPVSSKIPALTSGAVDILIGGTVSHNEPSLYMFASTGLLIPTWHDGMRKGYNFFYEFGIGPIIHKTKDALFSVFAEIDGIFTTSDINNPYPCDRVLKNNAIWIGPVFYWSYDDFITQFGVQAPLTQHYEQISDKRNVRVGASLFFKF